MAHAALASGIFSLTFGLIIFRPKGMKEGVAGTIGAVLMLLTGLINFRDIADILKDTGGILIMLFAMMIISIVVDEAGFFHWAACHSVRLAGGSGKKLFINTFLMGALVTTVISNDATALIITPIVYSFVTALGLNPVPFLLICTFIADTASLSLPVSNLTNLLVYDQLGLTFGHYVLSMLMPKLIAILINIIIFYFIFRKDIPDRYECINMQTPESYIKHRGFFMFAAITLVAVIIAYIVGAWLDIPLVFIALCGACLLVAAGRYFKQTDERRVLSQVSWSVLIFVVGMFTVVRGIQNTGLPALAADWMVNRTGDSLLKSIFYTSIGTAAGSNIINNVPMDVMMISIIESMSASQFARPLAYATILGAGLGPNLTVVGSLATMLWLGTIRRKGVNITAVQYFKIGLLTAPLMIAASALVLWISQLILG